MREMRRSVCPHDCPSQCALSVTVEDGRVADVAGDPTHPFTQGVICGKVHDYAERLYASTRVRTPLRRVGAKGEGRFEPVSWEAALEEIAHRWRRIIGEWGGEAILPYSYGGTLGLLQYWAGHPLFHALGASQLDRSICIATAYAGWAATLGTVAGNDAEQLVDSELVVLWGINASHTHINLMTLVKRARKRGAFVVCVDPYRTATARSARCCSAVRARVAASSSSRSARSFASADSPFCSACCNAGTACSPSARNSWVASSRSRMIPRIRRSPIVITNSFTAALCGSGKTYTASILLAYGF